MDIDFGADGSVSGLKTDFMKQLLPSIAKDSDRVLVHKPDKKSTIAACFDADGHLCSMCLKNQNIFVEIKSPIVLATKICFDCLSVMHALTNTLSSDHNQLHTQVPSLGCPSS